MHNHLMPDLLGSAFLFLNRILTVESKAKLCFNDVEG